MMKLCEKHAGTYVVHQDRETCPLCDTLALAEKAVKQRESFKIRGMELEKQYKDSVEVNKKLAEEMETINGIIEEQHKLIEEQKTSIDKMTYLGGTGGKKASRTEPEPGPGRVEIDYIECVKDKVRNANFQLDTDGGSIIIDKNGVVVFSYNDEINKGESFLASGILFSDVVGECRVCEDQASIKVYFKDGSIIADERTAFFKAFGLKPTEA